jgi:hypothetical protein
MRVSVSRKKIELVLSLLIVAFLAWAVWEARHWPAQSKLFPWSLGFTVFALALLQLAISLRAALTEGRAASASAKLRDDRDTTGFTRESLPQGAGLAPDVSRKRTIIIGFWIVAFYAGISLLGFKLGSLLLTFLFLKVPAKENWITSTAIAAGSYLFFWLVFDVGLKVPLGSGLLGEYFGFN